MPAFYVSRSSSPVHIVRKTADETVNNSTTPQDDDELKFQIAANEIWWVEAFLRVQGASTTADLKIGWTGPTGATANWSSAIQGVAVGTDPGAASSISSNPSYGLRAAIVPPCVSWGWFFADSSHAGTIQFQWAQNTQTVEDVIVKANSFLRCTKLA